MHACPSKCCYAPSRDRHPTPDSNLNWKCYALSTWRLLLLRITLANTFFKIIIIAQTLLASPPWSWIQRHRCETQTFIKDCLGNQSEKVELSIWHWLRFWVSNDLTTEVSESDRVDRCNTHRILAAYLLGINLTLWQSVGKFERGWRKSNLARFLGKDIRFLRVCNPTRQIDNSQSDSVARCQMIRERGRRK